LIRQNRNLKTGKTKIQSNRIMPEPATARACRSRPPDHAEEEDNACAIGGRGRSLGRNLLAVNPKTKSSSFVLLP